MNYEQIMNAARNADAAGDTEAAKRLVQMASRTRMTPQNLYSFGNRDMFPQAQGPSSVNVLDPVQGDPTPVTQIVDNVVGLDNGVMTTGEKIGTAINNAGEALTLGLVGDEAAGAFDAMLGRGNYEDRRDFYRRNQAQFREENPVASFASEVAPAFIPGVGAASVAGRAASAGNSVLRAGLAGGAAAGTYGFMEGEGGLGERAKTGLVAAGIGAGVGAAAPVVAGKISNRLKQMIGVAERRPTVEALRSVKNEAYKLVDESGEVFSGDDMAGLYTKVRAAFDDNNYVEEVDNASRAVLKVLERRQGQDTTLSQLDGIRQNLWKRYGSAADQPQILDGIKAIDDLIESKAGASELMATARAANAKFAKSQLIEDAFEKAADQTASTGSGGNIANKYKQALTSIINNPRKAKFFSQEEIDLMRGVVRGNPVQDVQRLMGKLSPEGNGLMLALHTIGGVSTGGATVPLMAAGAAAKRGADSSVMRGANQVQDLVAGIRPAAPMPSLLGAGAASAPIAEDTASGLLGMFR